MRTALTALAAVSVLSVSHPPSAPQSAVPASLHHQSAAEVVDRLRGSCASLGLTSEQGAALASLSARLQADRGHLPFASRDRGRGHCSPVFERATTSPGSWLNSALAILRPAPTESALAVVGRAPSSTVTTG